MEDCPEQAFPAVSVGEVFDKVIISPKFNFKNHHWKEDGI